MHLPSLVELTSSSQSSVSSLVALVPSGLLLLVRVILIAAAGPLNINTTTPLTGYCIHCRGSTITTKITTDGSPVREEAAAALLLMTLVSPKPPVQTNLKRRWPQT
mmetsp:Transcript_33804/g.76257  ORF Transcript_33804/g.76257 Transcript_33804/m.76257 type:complete len:106 (-) Transcript_33804:87-404(-)